MRKQLFVGLTVISAGIAMLSISAFGEVTYSGITNRASIEDKADILSDEEESELLTTAEELSEETGFEIRLVTTDDAEGMESSSYAEAYFESLTETYEGGCYLLDLDNREYYIATYGDLIPYITDARLEELITNAGKMAKAGNWKESFSSMLGDTRKYYHEGILPGTVIYDEETGEYTTYYETESEANEPEILQYNNYSYYINEDGTVTIAGWYGTAGKVIIPTYIRGRKVTVIGEKAFDACDNLKEVVFPDSIITIEREAFRRCSNMESLEVSKSVRTIEDGAFSECANLTSIEIPDSVTTIGACAFMGCYNVACLEIPDSVTFIGVAAFLDCGDTFTLIVQRNSYSEQYAEENEIPYTYPDAK